jgi:hypothetical protein
LGPLASNRVDNFFIGPLEAEKKSRSLLAHHKKFNIKSNQKICEKKPKIFQYFFSLESLGIGHYGVLLGQSTYMLLLKKKS